MTSEVRYSVRILARNPGFTLMAIAALSLGIGANCTIFSLVNAVLLRPLPYPSPDTLTILHESNPQRNWDTAPVSPGNFVDWRDRQRVFSAIAATRRAGNLQMTEGEDTERLRGLKVSSAFFEVLGIRPARGREIDPAEFVPGNDRVAIIGDGLWRRRFNSDPGVVGRTVKLNGEPYTLIGVMPPGFEGPGNNDLWAPLSMTPRDLDDHDKHSLTVYGRLRPGVSVAQAQTEMKAIAAQLEKSHAYTNANSTIVVRRLQDDITGPFKPALFLLFGAVGFVLLISCANVANLLLAQASVRRKEIAVRSALGAGRVQIVRQLLVESIVLSLAGGAAGLMLAIWTIRTISRLDISEVPRLAEAGVDARVLLFSFVLSLGTGLLFGLAPAFGAFRINLNEVLKQGGRAGSGGGDRLRRFLVVVEIAIAVALLTGAGLLLKSFASLSSVNPGFQPAGVFLVDTAVPVKKYVENEKRELFYRRLVERVSSIPGVSRAAGATTVPFGKTDIVYTYAVQGEPRRPPAESPSASFCAVTPDYFRAVAIPLQLGRTFTERDGDGGVPVAIVNTKFARKHWPNENPIGKYIVVDHRDPAPRQVVGVVGDVKHYGLDEETELEIYEPFRQFPLGYMTLVFKTDGATDRVAQSLVRLARDLEPDLPLYNVRTMEKQIEASIEHRKLAMGLLAVFAGLALLLAAMGTYGVMSYAVAQRTPEIGMRMALGAQPSDILALILKETAALTITGISSGLFVAFLLSRAISSQLFNVGTFDPAVYGTVVITLSVAALVASLIPALRAARVDPLVSVRYE